jgi:hypothetical protein
MLELNYSRDGSSIDVDEKWMDWSVEGPTVTSLVLTCIQNVEFQKLELKWSTRKSNKVVFLFLSPKFLDLILASNMLLGLMTC